MQLPIAKEAPYFDWEAFEERKRALAHMRLASPEEFAK